MSGIVENAVGGLIASEVHGLIELMLSRISADIKLVWSFKKELKELEGQFNRLSTLLQGASGMRITNPLMADWLKKINDAAYDADILLDEWSYKALKHRFQTRKWDKIKHSVSLPIRHIIMGLKVRDIRKLIGSIYIDATELGIKPIKVTAGEMYSGTHIDEIEKQHKKLSEQRQSADLQLFRGRDDDIEKLVELLCSPISTNSHLTVIGIVGLAGLGKTTLSKHIFNMQKVTTLFKSIVIWLVVSHNFDLMDLLNKMVKMLFEEAADMKDRQTLISKLQKKLKDERYLLILDDVWDTFDWETLRCALREIGGSKGTSLIVTSRDKFVVERMVTYTDDGNGKKIVNRPIIHELQGLSKEDSWSLLMARMNVEALDNNEIKLISRKMMKNCAGVPLAIRALGDLLRDKSKQRWDEIEKSDLWIKEDKNGILPSVRLSYEYLPHTPLKKCFAYCAIFKEDQVIEKDNLICMWMAQGFLQPYNEMELIGEEYIEHLLNSSLFQEAKRDESGNVVTFKMHDLVCILARDVSKGECLCLEKYVEIREVKHLSILNNFKSKELTSKSFIKLQSCLLDKNLVHSSLQLWLNCKRLRVLDVGRNWSEDLDWEPLGNLIHLRYFKIFVKNESDLMQRHNFSEQIPKLHQLQTLYIESFGYIPLFDESTVALYLKTIGNLVYLRHIFNHLPIGIPMGLSQLTALQTLPVIKLGMNWGGNVSELGLLTNVRGKLEIHCLTLLTVEEAHSLNLVSKLNLNSLVLKWDRRADKENPKANEILEALQPNENLHKLQLWHFDGTAFPKWLMGPDSPLINIVSLQIECCVEADGNLNVENFTCLRTLKVEHCSKLTVTFPSNKSQCCKKLEELQIRDSDKVEELPDLLLMPNLQVIEIRGNNSTSRDVLVGLGNLPYLRELRTDLKLPLDLGEQSPVCRSLVELRLDGSKYYNLPEQLQHLVALQSLSFDDFESVEAIPNWLGKLTSLETLCLFKMPKLKQLPPQDVMQSLSNLFSFNCFGCPILEEDFKNKTGEWFKISHIPDITPE